MRVLHIVRIVALVVAAVVAGCHALPSGSGNPPESQRPTPPAGGAATDTSSDSPPAPDVLNLNGVRDVEFGTTTTELRRRGVLHSAGSPCGPMLTDPSTVSPVFDNDRLVLLWASPPVRTPEGVTIGTPIDRVRATYPSATALTAPAGTYRFDGLLARHGDRAYLFLHDGHTVRKTIAGYADYARRLFTDGFGTC
mgnify:CR=1 FL=1